MKMLEVVVLVVVAVVAVVAVVVAIVVAIAVRLNALAGNIDRSSHLLLFVALAALRRTCNRRLVISKLAPRKSQFSRSEFECQLDHV